MNIRRLLFTLVVLSVSVASAHTRWFSHGPLAPYVTHEPTVLYLTVWGIISLGIIIIGIIAERSGSLRLSFLEPKESHAYSRAAATLSMVSGAFFIVAGTHEYLFSPNLSVNVGTANPLVLLQLLVGISFLTGIFERVAALLLVALWASIFMTDGWVIALEDVWVFGIAIFVFIEGNDYFAHRYSKVWPSIAVALKPYSLSLLRISTGLTLFTLGFSEKILHPEFGINFLQQYSWNFMHPFFPWYTDYLFTLSAGSVEALFGLVFMLGLVTRFNALVVAIFFTIPLFLLGPIELAGHLPHFAAVIILLLFGSGGKFMLVHPKR